MEENVEKKVCKLWATCNVVEKKFPKRKKLFGSKHKKVAIKDDDKWDGIGIRESE